MSLTSVVKGEAHRLGFPLVGITTPDPPPHLSVYMDWLGLGRHGSMAYLAGQRSIERRQDPRLVLPECRSILVLAARYPDPNTFPLEQVADSAPVGRVAAYAWGKDYHIVLAEQLQKLADFIQVAAGREVPYRYYTDTGPLLERELAQRGGLGWIGKNTCLINPRLGSYFLLAELLLGLELEPDVPFQADRCGKCTRCIRACPTGCILPDRTLDARRCISYLTIEEKQTIPAELRPLMGKWVFGCDICQVVCPWNRFSTREYEPAFSPESGLPWLDLVNEVKLTAPEFNLKFRQSPLQRTRRKRYLRNIAIALGNSGNKSALPALEEIASEADPWLREYALWAMDRIRT